MACRSDGEGSTHNSGIYILKGFVHKYGTPQAADKVERPKKDRDIMLARGSDVLIIDAKYYAHTTQTQYDVHTIHSGNLYQIFAYVKNKDAEFGARPHKVSGMLLYAATDETVQPDNSYRMSGNRISVRTLDLNREFSEIAAQLNAIVDEHFPAGEAPREPCPSPPAESL